MAGPSREALAPTRSLAAPWVLPVSDLKVLTRKGKVLESEPGEGGGVACCGHCPAPVSGMRTSGLGPVSCLEGLLLKTYRYWGLGVSQA